MQVIEDIKLANGVEMPRLFQVLPLIMGLKDINLNQFKQIIENSYNANIKGLDTSHDYGKSESFIGKSIKMLVNEGLIEHDDFFITSKIGNAQQYEGNIENYVDTSLKTLGLEQLDLMLLHWPVPDHYIENWKKLEKIYRKGKVKAIGIANARVRHLKAMEDVAEIMPHVVQTEIHPFNVCEDLQEYCKSKHIALQACSSLCLMITLVKENPILLQLGVKYNKSVAQIMLRWNIQCGIAPIFRAFKTHHIQEISEIFSFEITKEDMNLISTLNQNFRYHPESSNCAGF